MRKTYKYRLYPSEVQEHALDVQLGEACRLYNAALQERRDAYQKNGVPLTYYDQANQLKEIRKAGDSTLANFSSSQDILRRVDKVFQAFFRLQGVGHVKVKLHRPVDGRIKTVTVQRECGKWYACFSVEVETIPLPTLDTSTGIDGGLTTFAMLTDGTEIDNPRYSRKAQARLRLAQRRVARRKRGGKNRRKAITLLQKAHAHVKHQRSNFQPQVARTLVNAHGIIAVEDLNIKGLASGMLAKSVNDAGWAAFIAKLRYKAAEAGRLLVQVNPRGTSQPCLCGTAVPKTLNDRWHECPDCGLSAARDHVSAQNILGLGLSLLGLT